MKITAGGIPLGSDFYQGRQTYVDDLGNFLKSKDVLVLGPRRTGKTCAIKEYLRQREEADKNFVSIFIDLETAQNLYEFYIRIIKRVLNATSKWRFLLDEGVDAIKNLSHSLRSILEVEADLAPYLGTEGELKVSIKLPDFDPKKVELLAEELHRLLSKLKSEVVIVLDEFPELIWKFGEGAPDQEAYKERVSKTQFLMSGLRKIRQETTEGTKRHKFIVAGSINLDNTLQYLGLDQTINDVDRLKIPYLQPSQTVELMLLLCDAEKFEFSNKEHFKGFVEQQFGRSSPFYVQLYAEILRQASIDKMGQRVFSEVEVQKALKDLLTHPKGPRYLITRIDRYYTHEKDLVLKILGITARTQYETGKPIKDGECFALLSGEVKDLTREKYTEITGKLLSDDLIQNMEDGSHIGIDSHVLCNFWHHRLVDARFTR